MFFTGVPGVSKFMYKALFVVAAFAAGHANATLVTNGSFESNPDSAVVFDGHAKKQTMAV